MILVLLAIFIALSILFLFFYARDIGENDVTGCLFVLFSVFAMFCIVLTIILGIQCTKIKTYDSQIEVITEQNNQIEQEIAVIVKSYKDYEKSTYASTKIETENTDFIALAEIYPELHSDELVKSQIELYKENNKELKELKLKKAKGSLDQWWLYFHPIESLERTVAK